MSDRPSGFIDGMFKDIFGGYKYNPSLNSGERSAKALEEINSTLKKIVMNISGIAILYKTIQ
jgi:hypothetical protein